MPSRNSIHRMAGSVQDPNPIVGVLTPNPTLGRPRARWMI